MISKYLFASTFENSFSSSSDIYYKITLIKLSTLSLSQKLINNQPWLEGCDPTWRKHPSKNWLQLFPKNRQPQPSPWLLLPGFSTFSPSWLAGRLRVGGTTIDSGTVSLFALTSDLTNSQKQEPKNSDCETSWLVYTKWPLFTQATRKGTNRLNFKKRDLADHLGLFVPHPVCLKALQQKQTHTEVFLSKEFKVRVM